MKDPSYIQYLQEISKIPRITKEEERALIERMRAGDKEAREKLITANLRLVISTMQPYIGKGVDIMDLVQQGNLGLMYGIDRYDPDRGTALSTSAVYGIKKYIMLALYDKSLIRRPQYSHEIASKIKKIERGCEQNGDELPTDEDLADQLGVYLSSVKIARMGDNLISLDIPVHEEEEMTLADTIAAEEDTSMTDTKRTAAISEALKYLPEDEQDLLCRYYGVNGCKRTTLEGLAKQRGLTRSRIEQMVSEATRKLRHPDILAKIRKEL